MGNLPQRLGRSWDVHQVEYLMISNYVSYFVDFSDSKTIYSYFIKIISLKSSIYQDNQEKNQSNLGIDEEKMGN